MKRHMRIGLLCMALCAAMAGTNIAAEAPAVATPTQEPPHIQMAILLDTSGSMEGLIEQAKTTLWSVVNDFITTKKNGLTPNLQVALFEYGNDGLPAEEGFIRQILPLTDNLDKVSEELFKLTTNGGSEYCGQVIQVAAKTLTWSATPDDLKVIFIAGNEPFTQGSIRYQDACKAAVERGIIVNTIHCGSDTEGRQGEWDQGAALADGQFMNIDQNRQVVQINAPQDKRIAELGVELNGTYIAYGVAGRAGAAKQAAQDANAETLSSSVMAQRQVSKANTYYKNSDWDLVDAVNLDNRDLAKVKEADLPEAMRKMTLEERKKYVEEMTAKRKAIQDEINELNTARTEYVAAERKKIAEETGEKTLDEAILTAVRAQAVERNFER